MPQVGPRLHVHVPTPVAVSVSYNIAIKSLCLCQLPAIHRSKPHQPGIDFLPETLTFQIYATLRGRTILHHEQRRKTSEGLTLQKYNLG